MRPSMPRAVARPLQLRRSPVPVLSDVYVGALPTSFPHERVRSAIVHGSIRDCVFFVSSRRVTSRRGAVSISPNFLKAQVERKGAAIRLANAP